MKKLLLIIITTLALSACSEPPQNICDGQWKIVTFYQKDDLFGATGPATRKMCIVSERVIEDNRK